MAYCKNCGAQLSPNQTFCTKCGAKNAPEAVKKPVAAMRQKEKQPFSVKKKLGVIIGAVVLALLVGTHFFLAAQVKPIKVVEDFDQVIKSKDTESLVDIINQGQNQLTISEKEAASYLQYITSQTDYEAMKAELFNQASSIEDREAKAILDHHGNQLFKLEKAGKKWLLYDQYQLTFYPIEMMVTSNLDGATVWIDGKKVNKKTVENTSINAGYIFPGEHEVKSELKGKFSEFETESMLDFTESADNQLEVIVEFEHAMLSVESNDDEAALFVNGKGTNLEIGDIDQLGPVKTDGSITLHAERNNNGEKEQSEAIQINDESPVYLFFDDQEPVLEEDQFSTDLEEISDADIARFMDSYFTTMVRSINERDASLSETVMDLSGKAYPEHKAYLVQLEKKGITEDYHGMSLVSYEKVDGGYNVVTNEDYTIYYGDGTSKDKSFESEFFVSLLDEGLRIHTLIRTKER